MIIVTPASRDRAGIIAAIAAAGPGGIVQLESGEYTADTPASPPGGRRPYAVIELGTTELRGGGEAATTLHFTGDAGMIDWHGISLTNGSIHDLTIETSALTGTSEQTHAVRALGPATPQIHHVTFEHPVRGVMKGGDAIQLVGYAATPVTGARIHHNTFAHCDRSGVAAHSGCHDLEITDNVFQDVGDQDIDGEGSGDHFDWMIARNKFGTGPNAQGDISIELQGAERVQIVDNEFYGRSAVFAYSAGQVEIARNKIVRTVPGGSACIEIKKASAGINIHDNAIVRSITAGTGYLIRATPQGSGTPSQLTVRHNTMVQANIGDIINTVGMVGLIVEDNVVFYSGPPRGGYGVLANGSAGVAPIRSDDIHLTGNTWIGQLAGCIGISGSYGGVGAVTMLGEHAMGPIGGMVCGNAATGAKITGPIIAIGNSWPASTGCTGIP